MYRARMPRLPIVLSPTLLLSPWLFRPRRRLEVQLAVLETAGCRRGAFAARAMLTGVTLDALLTPLARVSSLGTRAGRVVHIGGRVVGCASGGIEVYVIVVVLEGRI